MIRVIHLWCLLLSFVWNIIQYPLAPLNTGHHTLTIGTKLIGSLEVSSWLDFKPFGEFLATLSSILLGWILLCSSTWKTKENSSSKKNMKMRTRSWAFMKKDFSKLLLRESFRRYIVKIVYTSMSTVWITFGFEIYTLKVINNIMPIWCKFISCTLYIQFSALYMTWKMWCSWMPRIIMNTFTMKNLDVVCIVNFVACVFLTVT